MASTPSAASGVSKDDFKMEEMKLNKDLTKTLITTLGSAIASFFAKKGSSNGAQDDSRLRALESQLASQRQERENMQRQLAEERRLRSEKDAQFKREMDALEKKQTRERQENAEKMKQLSRTAVSEQLEQARNHLGDLRRRLDDVTDMFDEKKEIQDDLVAKVHAERTKIEHFAEERSDPSIKKIVLLGMTGDGKSTLANRLAGDRSEDGDRGSFLTSESISSETHVVQKTVSVVEGQKISIVDTPGIADSRGYDREHINNIVAYLRGCGGVNQFLIVKSNGNPRFDDNYQTMLRSFEHMLGEDFWDFVCVVLTHVEGRRECRKFEGNSRELAEFLRRTFPRCAQSPLPVVAIGHEGDHSFEQVVPRLVRDVVPSGKFTCDNLTSPLEDLETELTASQAQVIEAEKKVTLMQSKVDAAEKREQDLNQRLQAL